MPQIFDFNVHLPLKVSDSIDQISINETEMADEHLCKALEKYSDTFTSLDAINFMVFNESLLQDGHRVQFLEDIRSLSVDCYLTSLFDFRQPSPLEYLEKLKEAGFSAIKFHSYVQQIRPEDYELAVAIARQAETMGMLICIDAGYGTTGMYRFDNLPLVCAVAEAIHRVPIIVLHSGGTRCFEAMLIAEAKSNVYLETSFTLPYFLGSSIESDLAFVYKKIGADRVLYASDAPYFNIRDARNIARSFFDRHGFRDTELEKIFYQNAKSLCES